MIYLNKNITISNFQEGKRDYSFTENGELYSIHFSLLENKNPRNAYDFKYEFIRYDASGIEIERVDLSDAYKDISDFYLIQENDPTEFETLHSIFSWGNQVIVSTINNRCYVYENGSLVYKYAYPGPFLDPVTSEDINAQKVNFATHFFPEKSGKLYLVANGSLLGRTNSRNRFIAGVSQNTFYGFEKEPFQSVYMTDLWTDHKGEPIDIQKHPFVPNMDLTSYGTSKILNKARRLSNPRIFQIIDLNEEECIVSLFEDSQTKSAYPDKNTPFLFLKMNKQTFEVGGNIAPQDGSIYKNGFHYLIVNDHNNERLIFKTSENLFIYDYNGKIIETINLTAEKISQLKKWVLIGHSKSWTYFYDSEAKDILGINLGANKSELISSVNEAFKEYKVLKKRSF